MQRLLFILFALCTGLSAAAFAADDNWDKLPAIKKTKAGLYLTPQQAYQRGGLDLLRLLDADRAQLDGQLTWVQEMVQYQLSLVALQSAEGIE